MMKNINNSLLNLFHIAVKDEESSVTVADLLSHGILFVDEQNRKVDTVGYDTYEYCRTAFGLYDNSLWNQTFHKSLNVVANSSIEELVSQQILHYMSTYGMEARGLRAMPVIPVEALNLNLDIETRGLDFVVIRVVSEATALEYVNDYLKTTLAPNKMMMDDIKEILPYNTLSKVEDIASFELRAAEYERRDIVPTEGADFLRYLIYVATGSTMLIKDRRTIESLKTACRYRSLAGLFARADIAKASECFLRFKPLWLAFKSSKACAPYINRMRRLAVQNHKPMSDVNVQNYTKLVKEGRTADIEKVLSKASLRQLIKLRNACYTYSTPALYNIRNGKSFVNADETVKQKPWCGSYVQKELYKRFHNKLVGKTYLIPSYIDYAAPVSEKQMMGNIPYGTVIHCPKDKAFTVGIAWENFQGMRTDLDLHMTGVNSSYGWNASYRDDERTVLFSGDMTDATNGAAEVFYFEPRGDKFILSANNFTGKDGVPFHFLVSEKKFRDTERDEAPITIAEAMFAPIPLKFKDTKEMTLGMFNDSSDFIIYGGELGNGLAPKRNMYASALEAMGNRISTMLTMRELLEWMGARVITEEEIEDGMEYTDLSPANLNSKTFFDIVDGNA